MTPAVTGEPGAERATPTESRHGYGWGSAAPPHSCAYLVPVVISALRNLGVRRVLDVGAGNGALCGALSLAGFEVVGLEADEEGVAVARRTHPGVVFHRASIDEDLSAALAREAPFDAVVSTEVIEHLYAPQRLPAVAARALAPRGYLVISTPYHGYLKNLALSLADKWDHHHTALWQGGHIKFFSRRTLTALVEGQGFDVVGFRGIGRLPFLWKTMLLTARRRD
jgi:2-polyprenyl-3-methyl-5-hydroxy-6-metoxy-1,4-benzoquinol methylase